MIYVLLLIIAGLLAAILSRLTQIFDVLVDNNEKLNALRLTSRTRQSKATMRNGAVSEERELVRLGRSSKGRRVVVGGDPDSVLAQNLMRGVPTRDDDDE